MEYYKKYYAQIEMNKLAKGYEITVAKIRNLINKYKDKMQETTDPVEVTKIQSKIYSWNEILRENNEIIKILKNYYLPEYKMKEKEKESKYIDNLEPFTIRKIVDLYVSGDL